MRNISAAALAAIQQTSNLEPAIVVRVWWAGSAYISYCDRKFEQEGLVGRLVQISGIDDIVDINSAASSVNLSITLDDSDGSLKGIYNTTDIHKTYVQILQWFTNIPLTDAFIIFEGDISSPIVWSEGERTLKFDVVTKLEDREVGFSVEEGKFAAFPSDLIGKSWPVVFGKVAGVKPLRLNENPTAILSSGFGIVDEEIWDEEIADLNAAMLDAFEKSRNCWLAGIGNALTAARFQGGQFPDDPEQAAQYNTAASSFFNQSSDYMEEHLRLQLELGFKLEEFEHQKSLQFRLLPITQSNLPSGIQYVIEVGNYTANGLVQGSTIFLSNLVEKVDVNAKVGTNEYQFDTKIQQYRKVHKGQKFIWIDGGTEIKIYNLPRYYILGLNHLNVLNVWARNKYGRAVVPRNWYFVDYQNYNGMPVTRLIFPKPLTSYPGEWQESDLEVDCVDMTIGTNPVDIMAWAISIYSSFGYDAASFNYVKTKVAGYPANFALTERMDVVTFLKEVAFQSRCAIWLNDRTFYLRFLPEDLAPVETVVDSDVEVNSAIVTSTDTERLVTKFTALWRQSANQDKPNKIIYRYNIGKYGTLEEEYDFFIYNQPEPVAKAAEFWMIRKSNTWKILQCKVFLNKLRIEAFDPVEFTFAENLVSSGPVTGIVQKATFNPDDDSVNLEAWIPIRLGEMTKYAFAFPGSVTDIYPVLADPNIITGNPYEDAFGEILPTLYFPPHSPITFTVAGYTTTSGTATPANQDPVIANPEVITALNPTEINIGRPEGINDFNNTDKYDVVPIENPVMKTAVPNAFMGFVRTKITAVQYDCDMYSLGLFSDPVIQRVFIGYMGPDAVIDPGTPIIINRTVYVKDTLNGPQTFVEYWAQPAIWNPTAVAP